MSTALTEPAPGLFIICPVCSPASSLALFVSFTASHPPAWEIPPVFTWFLRQKSDAAFLCQENPTPQAQDPTPPHPISHLRTQQVLLLTAVITATQSPICMLICIIYLLNRQSLPLFVQLLSSPLNKHLLNTLDEGHRSCENSTRGCLVAGFCTLNLKYSQEVHALDAVSQLIALIFGDRGTPKWWGLVGVSKPLGVDF